MVAQRLPDREVVVDHNRVRQPVVADAAVDVLRLPPELELRRVRPDDDQPEVGVLPIATPAGTARCGSS